MAGFDARLTVVYGTILADHYENKIHL